MKSIKEQLKGMVSEGWIEARFGKFENAKTFKILLEHKGIPARLSEILGHASTVDTDPKIILNKHFLVSGEKTAAHRILGKFV